MLLLLCFFNFFFAFSSLCFSFICIIFFVLQNVMDKKEIKLVDVVLEALSSLAPGPSVKATKSAEGKRKNAVKASSGKKAMTKVEHSVFDILPGGVKTWINGGVWNNTACPVDTLSSLVRPKHPPLLKDESGWDDLDI